MAEKEKEKDAPAESTMMAALRKMTGLPDDASAEAVMGALAVKCGAVPAGDAAADETAEMKKARMAKEDDEKKAAEMAHETEYKPPGAATMAKLAAAQEKATAELANTVKEQGAELARIRAAEAKQLAVSAGATFAKAAVKDGRWPVSSEASLAEIASENMKAAEKAIEPFKPHTFTLGRSTFSGGNPAGQHSPASSSSGGTWSKNGSIMCKGASLSKMAEERATKDKIDFGAAQLLVARENPHLYEGN